MLLPIQLLSAEMERRGYIFKLYSMRASLPIAAALVALTIITLHFSRYIQSLIKKNNIDIFPKTFFSRYLPFVVVSLLSSFLYYTVEFFTQFFPNETLKTYFGFLSLSVPVILLFCVIAFVLRLREYDYKKSEDYIGVLAYPVILAGGGILFKAVYGILGLIF